MRNGLSPALLADALEKLVRVTHLEGRSAVAGYVASHPPTSERMARLRAMTKVARSP